MGSVKTSQFDVNKKIRQFGFLIVMTMMGVMASMVMYAGKAHINQSQVATQKQQATPVKSKPVNASF